MFAPLSCLGDGFVDFLIELYGDYNANKLCIHEIHMFLMTVLKLVFCDNPGFPITILSGNSIFGMTFAYASHFIKYLARWTTDTWAIYTCTCDVVPFITGLARSTKRTLACVC